MTDLDKILKCVSNVTKCSPLKIKGDCRTKNYSIARFLFYGFAYNIGYRDYVIAMFLKRESSVAYYYRHKFLKLISSDIDFINLYSKIKLQYEKGK